MARRNTTNTTTASTKVMLAETVIRNSYEICGKKIASVPVELMELDHTYQRILGKTVKKLMAEWDNNKCDFLIVSYRNNRFYIIDGQHRYSVAKAKGIVCLPCIIFVGLSQQDEALKFAQQQDNVNKLTPYDTFKANIACGDETIEAIKVDLKIKRVCDKYGIQVKKYGKMNLGEKVLRCLAVTRNKHENFEWVMEVVNESNWANCSEAYAERIYLALYTYCYDNRNDLQTAKENIIKVMNKITPEGLETLARYKYSEYKIRAALTLCIRDLVQEVSK